MGAWIETCMLSKLPIEVGDPVVAFLVAQNPSHDPARPQNSVYDPDDVWRPISLPIRCDYDGRGFIERERSPDELELSLAILREGAQRSTADLRTLESLDHYLNVGTDRLCVKNTRTVGRPERPDLPVLMVMMHENVYDDML